MDDDAPLFIHSKINDTWKSQRGKFQKPDVLRHRMKIYLLYTVPSFLRQTNQNFTPWLDCRRGSIKEILPYIAALQEAGVIVTCDGGARRAWQLLDRGLTHAHVTRIDSDDMYDPAAVQAIRERTPQNHHSLFIRGYVWNIKTQMLMRIHHNSPPCYTLRQELAEHGFIKLPGYHGHNGVRSVLKPKIISQRLFLMTRHGKHVGRGPLASGPKLTGAARDNVIARYGLLKPVEFWEERNAKEVLKFVRS